MPTYLAPGVYIEEYAWRPEPSFQPSASAARPPPASAAPLPRWSADHSTAGFVGRAPAGPVGTPVRVESWREFEQVFSDPGYPEMGPFMEGAYLAFAVYGYFENGGLACWVVRAEEGPQSPTALGSLGEASPWDDDALPLEEDLSDAPGDPEDAASPDLDEGTAVGGTTLAAPSPSPGPGPPTGGTAGTPALDRLAAIDDVALVCAPDLADASTASAEVVRDLQTRVIAHCEIAGDRIAILDPPPDLGPSEVVDWRAATSYDSDHAALYHPWLEVLHPVTGARLVVPPCGHVAGVHARTDRVRGIHRNAANEPVHGVLGLGSSMLQTEIGTLNVVGINPIIDSPWRGPLVWGARTLSSDPERRFLRRRRLMSFIGHNIRRGMEWVIFEAADDRDVWVRIVHDLSNLLDLLWRSGALWGDTPEQAYWVKCDEETNPPELTEANQINADCNAVTAPNAVLTFRVVCFCG